MINEPRDYPWDEINRVDDFGDDHWSQRIQHGMSDVGSRNVVADLLRTHASVCVKRLQEVERQLREEFVHKEEVIRMVIVSAIAQQPLLLLGPPGVAKTKIVTRFCELLGVARSGETQSGETQSGETQSGETQSGRRAKRPTCFMYLLHAFSEPSELLGLLNLEALKGENPRFERLRAGSITDAEVVFVDEVFRGSAAHLNSMLGVFNERRVYEGGVACPAKARVMIGASNSLPSPRQMGELGAFLARFIIRVESRPVPHGFDVDGKVSAQRQRLLDCGWRAEVNDLRAGYDAQRAARQPIACLNDVLFLNRAVAELWGGDNLQHAEIRSFVDLYQRLVADLSGEPSPKIVIDDRRFVKLFLICRAHAIFSRNDRPAVDDLSVMRHCWDDPHQQDAVFQTVDAFIRANGGGSRAPTT